MTHGLKFDLRVIFLVKPLHRGAFCQLPFRWVYYCNSSKTTGKETGKTGSRLTHWKSTQGLEFDLRVIFLVKPLWLKVRFSQKVVICLSYRQTDEPFFVPRFQI